MGDHSKQLGGGGRGGIQVFRGGFFLLSISSTFLTIYKKFCESKTTNVFYTIFSFKWDPWWYTFGLSIAQVFSGEARIWVRGRQKPDSNLNKLTGSVQNTIQKNRKKYINAKNISKVSTKSKVYNKYSKKN